MGRLRALPPLSPQRSGHHPREESQASRALAVGTGRYCWVENRKGRCRDLPGSGEQYCFSPHLYTTLENTSPHLARLAFQAPFLLPARQLPGLGALPSQWKCSRAALATSSHLAPPVAVDRASGRSEGGPIKPGKESRPRPESPEVGGLVSLVPHHLKTAGVMVGHGSRAGTPPLQVLG